MLALWSIEIVLGIVMVAIGLFSYSNAICNCPAEIIGQPSITCNCVNPVASLSIWAGVIFIIIGAAALVLNRYGLLGRRARRR